MKGSKFSRRDLLIGSSALAVGSRVLHARRCRPRRRPSAVTPELIAAAKKEGKVVWYTSIDLQLAEEIGKALRGEISRRRCAGRAHRRRARVAAHRPGIFQQHPCRRRGQLVRRRASHRLEGQRLAGAYVPEDVAKYYPAEHKDPDGMFASFRVYLCIIAYNTTLVKKEEAPKSFADLLKPQWKSKIVKAHPGYSGTIMTATYEMARDLGWGYFEKLAQQNVLQVQSAAVRRRSSRSASARSWPTASNT